MVKLPAVWFVGLEDDKKEAFKNILLNNTVLIKKFLEILEDYEDQIEGLEISDEFYKLPEYEYRQSFINGRKRQLRDIKRLFEFN